MNIIDIASWQKGIDLNALFKTNPLDGVIVKATQGLTYVNTEYQPWIKWLTEHDKPIGVYHYCDGGDAAGEAAHSYEVVSPVIGRAIPVADYEGDALHSGTAWLKKFLDKFYQLSSVRAMIYCSLSVIHEQDFSQLTEHPLWVAQYADMNPVYGFLENPWQKGSVSPFPKYWMHQYTSCGQLNSWSGRLDFDKFYGTIDDWNSLCGKSATPTPAPAPTPAPKYKEVGPSVCLAVLHGDYKTGTERQILLREAGYDPSAVQRKINQLYSVAAKTKTTIGSDMPYIDCLLWIMRS
jgi:lysozyme